MTVLTKIIGAPFTSKARAKAALTAGRKRYHVALRGAVVIEDTLQPAWYVYLPLGGTGFSAAEWAGNLRAMEYEGDHGHHMCAFHGAHGCGRATNRKVYTDARGVYAVRWYCEEHRGQA